MQQRYVKYILDKINEAGQKYDTKGEQLLYEQGVLIGLLVMLSEYDSKNFELIKKRLEELK